MLKAVWLGFVNKIIDNVPKTNKNVNYFQSEFDPAIFATDVISIICSLIWPSFFCYFANSATDRVSSVGNTVYGLSWFDQPVQMQKYVILMVARSQERVQFSGLGLISCSMEAFGKVL